MSLGIAFKGPEGIVLAADSRVTLTAQNRQTKESIHVTFDNATKLLKVAGQNDVGAITYGLGALGMEGPRTAHSFMPELEAKLTEAGAGRLSVKDYAGELSTFFMGQWSDMMPKDYQGPDMVFLVGGYDPGKPYGAVYEFRIPKAAKPKSRFDEGAFGLVWGGQKDYVDRIIQGFDANLPNIVQKMSKLSNQQREALRNDLKGALSVPIPYQFLPLQDCVDLSIFLVRMTINIQKWLVGVRGVGGFVDVATITRTEGFKAIQQKKITGEE